MKLWMAPRSKDSSSSSARSIRASTIGSSPSTSGWSLERPISAPHAAAVQYSNGTSATGRAAAALRDRVAEAVHRELAHCASAKRKQRCRQHQATLRGKGEVHGTNADIALK